MVRLEKWAGLQDLARSLDFFLSVGKPLENFKKVYEESDLIFFYNKVIMIIKKKQFNM